MQIRAKLKGKCSKDGYLEIPVVIACSADESVVQAQNIAQVGRASQRSKRGMGKCFCTTGNNSSMGQVNDSNVELHAEEEGDKNNVNPTSIQGNFTDIVKYETKL